MAQQLVWSRKSYYSERIQIKFAAELETQREHLLSAPISALATVNSRAKLELVTEIVIFFVKITILPIFARK